MKMKSPSDDMVIKQAFKSSIKYLTRDDIAGKQVIDSNARIVGSVKDISFALIVSVDKGNDISIEGNNIAAIGDLILIRPKEQSTAAVPTMPSSTPLSSTILGRCGNCGYQNGINQEKAIRFCIRCGTKLQ